MAYRLVASRVRPGKSERLREWARVVHSRRGEAEATLRDEGVLIEVAWVVPTSHGDIFVTVVDEEDRERSRQTYEASLDTGKHPIDREHEEVMKECLGERLGDVELLYALFGR
jgi:uncharacterized protein DUF6176